MVVHKNIITKILDSLIGDSSRLNVLKFAGNTVLW